jgi:hypothetical protein
MKEEKVYNENEGKGKSEEKRGSWVGYMLRRY